MEIGRFFQAIETYGLFTVLIGFIFFMVWTILKSRVEIREKKEEKELKIKEDNAREERENERLKIEAERYDKLVNKIVEVVQKGPVHTVEEQEEERKMHEIIQKQLDHAVRDGADRAYYFTFHNGGKDALGRGLLKMSMFSESVARGEHILSSFQNIPRSMFPSVYKNLDEKGEYYIKNIKDLGERDQVISSYLESHGAKAALFRVIKQDDGLMLGYLGFEFNDLDFDFEKQKKEITKRAATIAGAIMFADENK